MELVRELSLSFADDGKRVKVLIFATLAYIIGLSLSLSLTQHDAIDLSGLCSRLHGGRCICWYSTSAGWKQKNFGIHGLG